jgi:hypothetical protein
LDHQAAPAEPAPDPLGLPAGWRSEQPLTLAEALRVAEPASHLRSSLLIHQLEPREPPVLTEMAELMLFAAATMKR